MNAAKKFFYLIHAYKEIQKLLERGNNIAQNEATVVLIACLFVYYLFFVQSILDNVEGRRSLVGCMVSPLHCSRNHYKI